MTGAPGQMHALSPHPILVAMPVLRHSKITSAAAACLILEEAGSQGPRRRCRAGRPAC
jgi:hypothetical protein